MKKYLRNCVIRIEEAKPAPFVQPAQKLHVFLADIEQLIEDVPEECVICIEVAKPAAFVQPAHTILTDIPIEEEELLTAAVCWILGSRPKIIPLRMVNG